MPLSIFDTIIYFLTYAVVIITISFVQEYYEKNTIFGTLLKRRRYSSLLIRFISSFLVPYCISCVAILPIGIQKVFWFIAAVCSVLLEKKLHEIDY